MSGVAKQTLRLKTARFDELWPVIYGPMSVEEQAEQLGIGLNHWRLIRREKRTPGPGSIAAIRTAMPNVAFDELFEVVGSTPASKEPVEAGDAA